MDSAALFARAVRVLPGGSTRATHWVPPSPPYAVRGDGAFLEDADGRRVVDLQGNQSALIHGHGHPALVAAATAAFATLSSAGLPTEAEVALAEALVARVPAIERVRFVNSGTEAVLVAVRIARAVTGRSGVLRIAGAYHGVYDAALAPDALGISPGLRDELVTVPLDDLDALAAAFADRGRDLACVLVDLMPNRAGMAPASPAFAAALAEGARRAGALLVIDEVITYRLGVDGLHGRYGLAPDLVTLGKVIGGGLPVGAVGGRADVLAVTDPATGGVLLGGTFSGNPVTMRAGLAALELLDARAIARLDALGDRLRARLADAGLDVGGLGSLLKLRDVTGRPERWWRLYEAGVLVATSGLAALSTPMDEALVDDVGARIVAALA